MFRFAHRNFSASNSIVQRVCKKYTLFYTVPKKYCNKPVAIEVGKPSVEVGRPVLNMMLSRAKIAEAAHHDILLYATGKEQSRWFNTMNAFSLSQLAMWVMVGCSFLDMKKADIPKDILDDEKIVWWRKLNFSKYKEVMALGCFGLAAGVCSVSFWHTARSVHHIVLRKGGYTVTLGLRVPVVSSPRLLTVPIEEVSCIVPRRPGPTARLKVLGKGLTYVVDGEGTFHRPRLFDETVGQRRFG